MSEEQNKKQSQDIDLTEVAKKIWTKRKLVIKNCGIAAVIGIIVAFSIPKEYETKVTLAPEASGKAGGFGGSLGSLASLAGINLGSAMGEDAISPELYPEILKSTPFIVELFNVPVETKKGDLKTTLYDYLDNHQKSSWFSTVISAPFKALKWCISLFKEETIKGGPDNIDRFKLTLDQAVLIKTIQESIKSSVDIKTGVITFSVSMQDPLISAALADTVTSKLQEYIINYRTNKARKDLLFAEKLYNESKKDYFKAQQAYAAYTDNNMNVVLARFKTEEERLKNNMNLMYQVYNQVAQQLQLAKAKVQEKTPVYTIMEPAYIPLKATSPQKVIVLFGFIFLAFIGTTAWILLKEKLHNKN